MSLHSMLARTAFRRSWGGLIAIVLVLAVGLGAAVTAIEAADRTVSAYPDYLERNDVADLVVNTVLANERTQEILDGTPGIERVVSDSLLTAAPAEDPDGTSDFLQFRVSQDGRYSEQDRPVVDEGRMIRSGMEVFLTRSAADELDAEVGEVVDVNFYGTNPDDPTGTEPGPIVREVSLEVVGIGTFADTVRPDAEVALGSTTARDLDLDVGDEVTLGSPYGESQATVAGLVVLPEIGPFQSDRTSLATGLLLPEATLEAVFRDAEEQTGLTPAALADLSAAVVMVDLADGTTGEDLLDDLGPLDEWDPTGFGVSFPEPVRAPAIVDLDAVRGAPAGLAGLFALGMAGAAWPTTWRHPCCWSARSAPVRC